MQHDLSKSPASLDEEDNYAVQLETKSGKFSFDARPDESLLFAGLRNGVTLPYECATGTCGSCRARVMSGSDENCWEDAPAAAKLKADKGDVLMCQTQVRSDCLLRVPATVKTESDSKKLPRYRRGTLQNLQRLTRDVICFEIELSEPMDFDAGQFATISLPGLQGARAYSMVNFVREARVLEFVVKQKPGGAFSDWLFSTTDTSVPVSLFGPLDRATFHPEEDKNIVMIAGGSGIAGMMSILERASQTNYFRDHKGYVFFGVRTLEDIFYLEHFVRHVKVAGDNLHVTLAISDSEVADGPHPEQSCVNLASGWVHEVAGKVMTGQYDDVLAYVAGPPPMVDGAIRTLTMEGCLNPQFIRYDKFG
uniref:Reductase n=1 Tax=Marinosulfonomonas methylotropha TaxID=50058 RepID=Q93NQ5_9RHOB|nr:reductase [Marinosulfonomonas methylotropha]